MPYIRKTYYFNPIFNTFADISSTNSNGIYSIDQIEYDCPDKYYSKFSENGLRILLN